MRRALLVCALIAVAGTLFTPGMAAAHEPIFSIGPRVIWRDGIGFEFELQRQRLGAVEIWALNYEVLYGLTANQALTVKVPQVIDKRSPFGSNSGLGDVLLRYKWRFYKKDVLGGTYQAAVLGGVEFPTGEYGVEFPTGSGTVDLLTGMAVDYEGRRWLAFGAGRFKFNGTTDTGVDVGNALLLDAAVGFRPVRTSYRQLDTVIMAELNYESHGQWENGGTAMLNTGGDLLFLSTGVWFTYRNHAFKPGIQIPIHTELNGTQQQPDWKAVFAYEVHFGSVFGR